MSGLYTGCMILKQDFMYSGNSENFNLGNIFFALGKNLNQLQELFVYHLCIYWGIKSNSIPLIYKGELPL
jgi:hypothetical protein